MKLRWQQNYGLIVMTLFGVFFVLYGFLGAMTYGEFGVRWFPAGPAGAAVLLGLLGGWGFGGLFGGFWLTFRFIGQKSMRFKVLACVLFFIPVWTAMLLGMTMAVPYAVYCLVSVRRARQKDPQAFAALMDPYQGKVDGGRPAPLCMYKDTYAGYLLGSLLLAALMAAAVFFWDMPVVLVVVLFVLGVLAAARAMNKAAGRRVSAIVDILRMGCDPQEYIRRLEALLSRQRRSGNRLFLLLQLSTGFLNAGDPAQAHKILEEVSQAGLEKQLKRYGDLSAMLYNNLAACQIASGELCQAEQALAELGSLLIVLPPAQGERYKSHYTTIRYKLALAKGEAEGCAQYFSVQTELEQHPYKKADCQYHLAEACLMTGEQEKAREALRYVTENGNKLHVAEKARRQLQEMA